MAIYKPTPLGGGDPPRVNQRIDGTIYTYNKSTNTLNKWSYPRKDRSARFSYVNGNVQSLDAAYDQLSGGDQAAWTAFYDPDWFKFFCWTWDEFAGYVGPDDPGKAAYRATNLCRIDQGLTPISTPPTIPILGNPNTIEFDTPQWQIRVSQAGVPYAFNIAVSIYGYGANGPPTLGEPPYDQFKFLGNITVVNNVWTDLSSFLDNTRAFGTAPFKVIEIRAGPPGCVSTVRGRTTA